MTYEIICKRNLMKKIKRLSLHIIVFLQINSNVLIEVYGGYETYLPHVYIDTGFYVS